jgi:UPF0755 protein
VPSTGRGGARRPGSPRPPGAGRSAKGRGFLAAGVGVLIVVFVIGAWYAYEHRPTPSNETTVSTVAAGSDAPDVKLLLPPGFTLKQIADRVGQIPGHTAAKFLAAAAAGTSRSKYQPAGTNVLEGLLFPDTYFVGAKETDDSILKRLVSHFDQIADKDGLASSTKVTSYQALIVASLVEKEVKVPEEAPTIAAVIYNRLAKKMQLQIDATLCYAKGGCPPLPTDADKKLTSPYNTYAIAGLPPTPIASVSEVSLKAALAPANVPYLYYVISDSAGHHAFATTNDEQNKNVAAARAKGLL